VATPTDADTNSASAAGAVPVVDARALAGGGAPVPTRAAPRAAPRASAAGAVPVADARALAGGGAPAQARAAPRETARARKQKSKNWTFEQDMAMLDIVEQFAAVCDLRSYLLTIITDNLLTTLQATSDWSQRLGDCRRPI
jgi:hypothetical protein